MSDLPSAGAVAGLALAAAVVVLVLVAWLRRRPARSLRRKIVCFFIGLAAVEFLCLPALILAWQGDVLLGWRASGADGWIAGLAYGALSLWVVVRLFPWREVEALASRPDASLREVLREIARDGNGGPPAA